jgi:hypothetical protein
MRGASVILVLAVGLVASVFVAREGDPPPPVPERLAADRGTPPAAPAARCPQSITVAGHDPLAVDDEVDKVIGPVRIIGLGLYEQDWQALVDEDQWMKAALQLEPGARVTLEIPEAQRAWSQVEYGGRGGDAITLRACSDRPTVFIGGFTIDYAKAPREGRCAELTVWGDGPAQRVKLFESLC